jgi:hypothetical protein
MHSYAGDLSALLDVDLARCGWSGSIEPYPGMSVREMAMQSLRKSFIKKFHNDETSDVRNSRALSKFTQVNEECKNYTPPTTIETLPLIALNEAKDFIQRFCFRVYEKGGVPEPILSLYKIEPHCGFGRGANIGARSGDPYGKLAISNLSHTNPALLVMFQHTIAARSLWLEQEQFRAQNFPTALVQGSKLSFVPKTSEITRTICTEPILNMFFQKGIASILTQRLREVVGIDFTIQQGKNSELARRGSISGDFGTIDLSSASDSMSLALVREWFPPEIVYWLELTRSKVTTLENGSTMDLHMVSSMGNAYTFPLQTLFFTSLVFGAYRALDIPIKYPFRRAVGNFAVYGDDIIIDKRAYALVVKMLSYCGFTVNEDKSFNEGLFRESCGSDYYMGHDVRGVYLQKLLDDLDFYSAYNRLAYWCARHEIYLMETLTYLKECVKSPLHVPLASGDDAGFKVPLAIAKTSKSSWHKGYQSLVHRYTYAARKRCFVKLPADESELTPKLLKRIRRKIPFWRYCPSGIMLLLLHGNIRDGRILLRDNGGSAENLKGFSSCWDYCPSAASERGGFEDNYHFILSQVWLTW